LHEFAGFVRQKAYEETFMTATRNTLLALGLTLLALAANGSNALAEGCGTGCEATCEAGCQGCDGGGSQGFSGQGFCHDPCCRYADNPECFEADPVLGRFAPLFRDLRERCDSCTWRFDASAIYLHRAEPSSINLLSDPTSGAVLLNANQMEFPYRVGPRFDFVVTDCAGLGLELNYFSVDGWSVSRDFATADFPSGFANLNFDSGINPYPLSDAHVDFASMLHSSEINIRQRLFGQLDFLTGFRWVDMFDRYEASGTSFITGNTMSQRIETRNHIFGWQIGLDGRLFPSDGPFQLGAFVKAGGALNNATSSASLSDPGNLGDLSATDHVCHVAFVGEAGLTGYFQIDKHISCSAGYQVMYINNVAQPVDQIAQTDLMGGTTLINVGNGIFYHGGNLGIEVSW
jgi:hypothetical protein